MLGFSRWVFPVTLVLGFFSGSLLLLGWLTASGDYQMHICTTPLDPWCISDLQTYTQIEIVALVCFLLIVLGLVLNRRSRGAAQFLSLVSVLIMTWYVLPWYLWLV